MIAVIGEALVDLVIAPDGSVTAALGGAPYNTARAAARLGAPTRFVGPLSTDRFGERLAAGLTDAGVDVSAAPRTDLPTTLAAAEIDDDGGATYRFYLAGTSVPSGDRRAVDAGLSGARTCFTGGLGLVVEPFADHVAAACTELPDDAMLVVDVNCRPRVIDDRERYLARLAPVLARADLVKVSDEDLAYLAPGEAVADAADAILDGGARSVVVTAGARGATVHAGGAIVAVPTPPLPGPVVDTIGAGDTFGAGVLAWWHHRGLGRGDLAADTLADAVAAAHEAAAVVVTRRGADPPRRAELSGAWA